jgi:hypothetical protein
MILLLHAQLDCHGSQGIIGPLAVGSQIEKLDKTVNWGSLTLVLYGEYDLREVLRVSGQ